MQKRTRCLSKVLVPHLSSRGDVLPCASYSCFRCFWARGCAGLYKSPSDCRLLIHFSCLLLLGEPGPAPPAMSCYDLCAPGPCGPTPLANSCSEPCVRQCQDSTVLIQPSPVVVTLPGPILSSFPQSTTVGSSASAAVGSALSAGGVPISSGGSLALGGFGYPGLGGGYNRPSRRSSTFRGGFYGPC
ncbi:beta-keratin-related protein-like isoform X1 [Manacus candei]|nr:beta-keratin-related protein-like isoform X1 [Manacus candei]